MKNIVRVITIFCWIFFSQPEANAQLQEFFMHPLEKYRPNLNIHNTPKNPQKQDSILNQYLLNGYGGLATNVNWTDDYLKNNQEIFSMFRFAKSARSKGMNVWLYDENWYPSGMAGGYILQEHPDWEVEGLLFKDSLLQGPSKIQLRLLPGRIIAIKAIPVVKGKNLLEDAIELNSYTKDSLLNWDVKSGSWRIVQISTNILRRGFQSGSVRGGKAPHYTSLLMPEVTKRFIELTHQKYAEVLGANLGSLFYSTFTDEPSLMAQPFTNQGYGLYPWKKNLSIEFERRFGYKLEDKLLLIMLDDGRDGQKLRYQYFSLVREMVSQNFFKQIREFCQSQGIKSGGHLLLEESLMAQVPLYGDIMACFREMDVPGIDVLTAMPEFTRRYLYSSRLASSSAELEGRGEVMSEICPIADHRKYNGKEAPTNDVKGTVNRQLVGGVTRFNNYLQLQHASQQEKMDFNTYIARVSTLMSGGVRASKIAVLYPIESMWTKFKPINTWLKGWDQTIGGDISARKIERALDQVSDCLYDNRLEFSYIDTKALLEAKIIGRELNFGLLKCEVLVLPRVETLPIEAWKVIEAFVKSGGKIIAVEALPENSTTDFPSAAVTSMADRLFVKENKSKKAVYMEQFSAEEFQKMINSFIQPDYLVQPASVPILCSHKKIEGFDVLFVINDSNQTQTVKLLFSASKKIQKWDPNTGDISETGNQTELKLGAFDGTIFRYK